MSVALASQRAFDFFDLQKGIYAYLRSRSTFFLAERLSLAFAEFAAIGKRPRLPIDDPELFRQSQLALVALLEKDAERFADGTFPLSLLWPEPPLRHALRLPQIFFDAMAVVRRRELKRAKDFSPEAEKLARKLPEYYRRNFHFQSDGYLSQKSAELYEHQVELLFAGAADSMRRLIFPVLKERLRGKRTPRILEVGAGVGTTTRMLRTVFPEAEIRAIDLSLPYLQEAARKCKTVDWREGDATQLSERNQSVDVHLSVFLFHELPLSARKEVVAEAARVLRKGGTFIFVDSLQKGDDSRLDKPLLDFPKYFHEPFYKNYLLNPMNEILETAGLRVGGVEQGFFSKCVWAKKL